MAFERPLIILAAPRSGSTLLFETLAKAPGICTIGDESHGVIEGLPALRPGARPDASNRLLAEDATPERRDALLSRFAALLRDRDGQPPAADKPLTFLEKTPKNALRLPFLEKVFPGARYVFLVRGPRPNISSMMEAWASGRWVTYPGLRGWDGPPWSLLLPPGWQAFAGRPVAEICAWQWAEANRTIMEDLQPIPADRWLACEYTDLVRNPETVIRRICAFASLAIDDRLLERVRHGLPPSRYTQTAPSPDKWHRNEAAIEPLMAPGHPLGVIRTWRKARRLASAP